MAKFPWGEKPIARLRRLIEDKCSSNETARILASEFEWPLTRNSVMSKAMVLGLHFQSTDRNGRSAKVARSKLCAAPPAPQGTPNPAGHPQNCKSSTNPQVMQEAPPAALIAPAPISAALLPPAEIAISRSDRIALLDLREGMCKWPIGDPTTVEFRFCGAKSPGGGRPYCGYHAQVAYQLSPRRQSEASNEKRRLAALKRRADMYQARAEKSEAAR